MAADSYSRECGKLLQPVIAIAREAGKKILEIYDGNFSVKHKPDESPVTEADIAAHHVIIDGLKALTPELPVLSEESAGDIPFGERARWHCYWLVDPLDGTREFIKRNGEFTVNIALIEGHAPVLGVIHAPVSGICYFASRRCGAYRQEKGEGPQQIHSRATRETPVIAVSRSRCNPRHERLLEKIGAHEVVAVGSSLKSCLVAEGSADLYARLGPTSEWDTAAAQCIVEQAGGHITDTRMQPLGYNTKPSLLNPDFFVFGATWRDWSRYL